MSLEQALKAGERDEARAILDELAKLPDTGGLWMPECYAELARACDHGGRHDEAIAAMELAIEHGWSGRPDGRSDIAEFHLRAGRAQDAAAIWAQLKRDDPDEIWLYNAAGLSYSEAGEHELAVAWLGEGLKLAMRSGDPEGIAAQLSDVRRSSLRALGRGHGELEERVRPFLERWRAGESERDRRSAIYGALEDAMPPAGASRAAGASAGGGIAIALSWFPAGEYERAIERWTDLGEEWAEVPHPDYCRRLEGHMKWMRGQGVLVRAVAPIVLDDYIAWCEQHGANPEEARASYAAERMSAGEVIEWPPARNEPCWCGSGRKYKKCCSAAPAAPAHARET